MAACKGRILCTEDDDDTRELIIVILSSEGFDVTCAKNAVEALRCAESARFDLYILDNWLPDISGVSLCERLRKQDATTPILFCSGAAYDIDKQNAYLAGAQGYLVKPVPAAELIAEVVRLIAESRSL